jgi:hypothetical protein
MNLDRSENWQQLEVSLLSLLCSVAPQLKPESCQVVRDLIENREYGVALEWLTDAALAQGIRLSDSQLIEVDRMAKLMKLDLNR